MSELESFAKVAEQKLGERLNSAKARNLAVIEQIEKFQPNDRLVKGRALRFSVPELPAPEANRPKEELIRRPLLRIGFGDAPDTETLHPFALSQMLETARMPKAFSDELMGGANWSRELLAHNLNTIYGHSTSNHLLRSVNGSVRGFLSDRYRRLDSRPLVEAFLLKCREVGAVMADGHFTDTKIMLKAVMPRVYHLSTTEVVLLGVMFGNSDFGNGPLEVSFFIERLVCRNGMVAERSLRKIHLGARLAEDINWSKETQIADLRVIRNMVGDLVAGQLGPGNVNSFVESLKSANEKEVTPDQIGKFLSKELTKKQTKQIVEQFNSPDVVNLPPGQTQWRLSNAISLVANTVEDEEDRVDLQKLAGLAAHPSTFA